jgi:hypothetical protein
MTTAMTDSIHAVLPRVRSAFFSRLGAPISAAGWSRVGTWPKAVRQVRADEWLNTRIEWRNHLTEEMSRSHPAVYNQEWNPAAVEARTAVDALVREVRSADPRVEEVAMSIRTDLIFGLQEHRFSAYVVGPAYFVRLLAVYEAGHFPCGKGLGDALLVF